LVIDTIKAKISKRKHRKNVTVQLIAETVTTS
jgi:hypothetical protein